MSRPKTRALTDADLKTRLDDVFDACLGRAEPSADVVCAVPAEVLDEHERASRFEIGVGSIVLLLPEIDAATLWTRARLQGPGRRVKALREGKVRMFSDDQEIGATSAVKWLEVVLTVEGREYFLLDGEWHEIDPAHLEATIDEIGPLPAPSPQRPAPRARRHRCSRRRGAHARPPRGRRMGWRPRPWGSRRGGKN